MARKSFEQLKKEQEIRMKYKIYFDILLNCGGALYLNQLKYLVNKSSSQIGRDIKYIEENTNLMKTLTNDENYKICVLTTAGWSIANIRRNESSCAYTTLESNGIKAFKYKHNIETNIDTKVFLEYEICKLETNIIKNEIDLSLLNSKEFVLGDIKYTKSSKLIIDVLYLDKTVSYKKLLKELESLYSIFELITENNTFKINLDIISLIEVDKKSFFEYLYDYRISIKGLKNQRFKKIFYKNFNKKISFFCIETNLDVTKY